MGWIEGVPKTNFDVRSVVGDMRARLGNDADLGDP